MSEEKDKNGSLDFVMDPVPDEELEDVSGGAAADGGCTDGGGCTSGGGCTDGGGCNSGSGIEMA